LLGAHRSTVPGRYWAELLYPAQVATIGQSGQATVDSLGNPAPIEPEFAEELIDLIPCAEMVKFAKNGSDVTTAAVRLARAATGRDIVAFPAEHPFYSFDDWFIGTTVVDAGVPVGVTRFSRTFPYGDLPALERLLENEGEQIAAVIMETATDAQPPSGYLQSVRELTSRHGVLLIFDEIITGVGRTGRMFAAETFGVVPDVLCTGKGMSGGYVPLSAMICRRGIADAFWGPADRNPGFVEGHTFEGNPISCAAGLAVLEEILERDLCGNARLRGERLRSGFERVAENAHRAAHHCGQIHFVLNVQQCAPAVSFGTLQHLGQPIECGR